jgi:rhodanese-related sulfurtransferase
MGKAHAPGFIKIVNECRGRIKECTVDDVLARRSAGEAFTLVDVREESEYAAGHIPGAVHIGKGVLERDIEAKVPDAATPLVLYCGGGYRSALAADTLQRMGYTSVISMDGGWRDYTSKGLPVEK